MLVSFIIPAYNASKTIIRCLDSVIKLRIDRSEYEVIVIDDCSLDHTAELVKEIAENQHNLILLRQIKNHRQGAARNRALSIAKGKYIVFLDSDDEIASGVLSAIDLAERNSLEMTIMRSERLSLDGAVEYIYELSYDSNTVFSGVDFQNNHPFWCTGPVLYVYLKVFLESVNYSFAEDVLYEDSDFVSVHLYNAKRVGYCDECGYLIYINPSSTTHTVSYKHVCDYALLGTRMLSFYNRIENKETTFAESILEGGSWNIMQSFKNLFKLSSKSDIRLFYTRFDRFADRSLLLEYKEPEYCWTRWTRFCLKHRQLATGIIGFVLSTGLLRVLKRERA